MASTFLFYILFFIFFPPVPHVQRYGDDLEDLEDPTPIPLVISDAFNVVRIGLLRVMEDRSLCACIT